MSAARRLDGTRQGSSTRPGGESPPASPRAGPRPCAGPCARPCAPCGRSRARSCGRPLRFEQRGSPREPARGRLAATYRDPEDRPILTRVELSDLSETGLSVYAPLPARVGSMIELHDGPTTVFTGTVARCRASLTGHLIGLRLVESARAA